MENTKIMYSHLKGIIKLLFLLVIKEEFQELNTEENKQQFVSVNVETV